MFVNVKHKKPNQKILGKSFNKIYFNQSSRDLAGTIDTGTAGSFMLQNHWLINLLIRPITFRQVHFVHYSSAVYCCRSLHSPNLLFLFGLFKSSLTFLQSLTI